MIIGDANLAELSTYLKVGTTSLVLAMIEARALAARPRASRSPVEALQAVSHDPSLTHKVRLRDGRRLTALELQQAYLEQAREVRRRPAATTHEQTADVLRRWARGAGRPRDRPDALRRPAGLAGEAAAAGGLPRRATASAGATRGCTWSTCSTPTCGPDKGLYHRLVARGSMQRLLTDDEVDAGDG